MVVRARISWCKTPRTKGTVTARQYTSWTDAAGQDSLAIRIGKTGDGTTFYCMFDEFRLWGNLATPAPTAKPTDVTTSPTRSTAAPSNIPTISTNNPTATPSNNPSASSNDPTATPSKNPSASSNNQAHHQVKIHPNHQVKIQAHHLVKVHPDHRVRIQAHHQVRSQPLMHQPLLQCHIRHVRIKRILVLSYLVSQKIVKETCLMDYG
eukprot:1035942_1